MQIDGISVLISGGASGLGEATARELAAAGATVVIADLNAERGNEIAAELGGVFVSTNVTDEASVQGAVDAAVATGRPLRLVVACAGIAIVQRTLARDGSPHAVADYQRVLDINLTGSFNLLRQAASAMTQVEPGEDGERGLIVLTASVAAFEGQIGQIAYASSKGGIVGMTTPAARDLAAVGIRVNAIAPGVFETPMVAGLPPAAQDALAQDVLFPKRLGKSSEYAKLVRFLAEMTYLNAEVIRLDGGIKMPPK
jgi:NAD(P)-dependent dehydrogenase (short-subunit alcohol dehydrogenase family)